MRKMTGNFFLFTMAITLVACRTNEMPTTDTDNGTPSTQEEQNNQDDISQDETIDEDISNKDNGEEQVTNDFEPEIEATIEIEGMEETITMELYDNEAASFITYVPADFIAEEASDGEGDSYWFYANYQGEKIEEVNLHIYFFSEAVTEEPSLDDGEGTLAMLLEDMELVNEEEKYYDWALDEYQSPEGSRRAMLGEHEGQYFAMILNSTVEYSAGFYPRANKIIDHFYWKDTQEYLMQ